MSHTNYNAVSNKKTAEETPTMPGNVTVPQEETPTMPVVTPPAEPEFIFGTVVNCKKLNVREEPTLKAAILCVIEKDTQVVVYPAESTNDWYKINAGGQEGFCMKKYMMADA